MDRFITSSRSANGTDKSKAARNVSARQRHSEFVGWTHVSGQKLFCTPCNLVLDHTRKSSVESHTKSERHRNAISRKAEEGSDGPTAKKQKTLDFQQQSPSAPQTVSSAARNELCKELVSTFAAANIPLSKVDHPAMRDFLQKRVVNGGAIPKSKQLQECYLLRELQDQRSSVRSQVINKPVAVICDEMSDDIGRFVLNILVAPLEPVEDGSKVKSYLLETQFLQSTNASTVSAAIVKCLVENGIKFEDVITVNTDNAAYMKKAYKDSLKGLMPNSTHITCMAHVMNLLGEAFRKPFEETNKFVRAAKAIFWNAGARKARYLRSMSRSNGRPKMPPNPVGTRWNCWFDAVKYHKEHLSDFGRFVEEEAQHCGRLAPESLMALVDIFSCPSAVQVLEAEMSFITKFCEDLINATNLFQSQEPNAVKAWARLEDLHFTFGSGGIDLQAASAFFPEGMKQSQKLALQDRFCMAFYAANKKLEKYMSPEGQPGIDFIKQIQFFDPSKLIIFEESDFSALPLMKDVPGTEIKRYRESLGPRAVKVSGGISVDLTVFWNSIQSEVPELAACALKYIYACLNSADAERSFSIYNLVFSERRRSLNEENLRALVFLYYNNFITYESLI